MVKPVPLATGSLPLMRYYDTADKILLMGEVYRAGGDEEQLFILSLRFLRCVLCSKLFVFTVAFSLAEERDLGVAVVLQPCTRNNSKTPGIQACQVPEA